MERMAAEHMFSKDDKTSDDAPPDELSAAVADPEPHPTGKSSDSVKPEDENVEPDLRAEAATPEE
jgi:hypothetical protein